MQVQRQHCMSAIYAVNMTPFNRMLATQKASLPQAQRTLKPPAVPSRFTSTVPGFAVLHMLQVLRRAQLVLPQPLHVQSPGANIPALGLCNLCLCFMAVYLRLDVIDTTRCAYLFCNLWGNNTNGTRAHLRFQTAAGLPKTFRKASIRQSWAATWGAPPQRKQHQAPCSHRLTAHLAGLVEQLQ